MTDLKGLINQFCAIKREIGSEALVSPSLNIDMGWKDDRPCYVSVYPDGVCGNTPSFYVFADTWEELLSNVISEWKERTVEFNKKTVREMALAIIRITADLGSCSDASLRANKFTNDQIEFLSAAAIEDANNIASNGPFAIVAASKSNER